MLRLLIFCALHCRASGTRAGRKFLLPHLPWSLSNQVSRWGYQTQTKINNNNYSAANGYIIMYNGISASILDTFNTKLSSDLVNTTPSTCFKGTREFYTLCSSSPHSRGEWSLASFASTSITPFRYAKQGVSRQGCLK